MISDDAAYAANWRTVLAADALLGVAVVVIGALLGLLWSMAVVGSLLVVAGAAYVVLVARRWRRWRALRRDAGLP